MSELSEILQYHMNELQILASFILGSDEIPASEPPTLPKYDGSFASTLAYLDLAAKGLLPDALRPTIVAMYDEVVNLLSPTNTIFGLDNQDLQWLVTRARLWAEDDQLISVTEASYALGVSIQAISSRIARGNLNATTDKNEPNPRRATRLFAGGIYLCDRCGSPMIFLENTGERICPAHWVDKYLVGNQVIATEYDSLTKTHTLRVLVSGRDVPVPIIGQERANGYSLTPEDLETFSRLQVGVIQPPPIDFAPLPWWIVGSSEFDDGEISIEVLPYDPDQKEMDRSDAVYFSVTKDTVETLANELQFLTERNLQNGQ